MIVRRIFVSLILLGWVGLGVPAATATPLTLEVAPKINGGPSWRDFKPSSAIHVLAIEGNTIWAGGINTSVVQVDTHTGNVLASYTTRNSPLLSDQILAIGIDSHGNKWFGTDAGVSKFDGSNWTDYTKSNSGLPDNYINAVVPDNTGRVWFGTRYGLVRFDGSTWESYNTSNSGLIGNSVNSIAIDSQGSVWVGANNQTLCFPDNPASGGALSKFDGSTWQTFQDPSSLTKTFWIGFDAITIDNNNNKWLGSADGQLSKFNQTDPALATNSSGFNFNYVPGKNTPALQTLNILAFNADINWTLEVNYTVGASGWLTLPASGTSTVNASANLPIKIEDGLSIMEPGIRTVGLAIFR